MDKELLIQNIIRYCAETNEPPTNACYNAGVGKSFIANMRKGQTPSVAKVAALAAYLGVTTSDLVGDARASEPALPPLDAELRRAIERADEETKRAVLALLKK